MILQQKAMGRERQMASNRVTAEQISEVGRVTSQQKQIDNAFYRSQRGATGHSFGMQGVLNSGDDYGYAAKNRVRSSRQQQRMKSAGTNSRTAMSMRSGKSVHSHAGMPVDSVSYNSRVSGTSQGRRRLADMLAQNMKDAPMKQ